MSASQISAVEFHWTNTPSVPGGPPLSTNDGRPTIITFPRGEKIKIERLTRNPDVVIVNDLQPTRTFPSKVMSKVHASLSWSGDKPLLTDRGSTHGTSVTSKGGSSSVKLIPHIGHPLEEGDFVKFGIPVASGNETHQPVMGYIHFREEKRSPSRSNALGPSRSSKIEYEDDSDSGIEFMEYSPKIQAAKTSEPVDLEAVDEEKSMRIDDEQTRHAETEVMAISASNDEEEENDEDDEEEENEEDDEDDEDEEDEEDACSDYGCPCRFYDGFSSDVDCDAEMDDDESDGGDEFKLFDGDLEDEHDDEDVDDDYLPSFERDHIDQPDNDLDTTINASVRDLDALTDSLIEDHRHAADLLVRCDERAKAIESKLVAATRQKAEDGPIAENSVIEHQGEHSVDLKGSSASITKKTEEKSTSDVVADTQDHAIEALDQGPAADAMTEGDSAETAEIETDKASDESSTQAGSSTGDRPTATNDRIRKMLKKLVVPTSPPTESANVATMTDNEEADPQADTIATPAGKRRPTEIEIEEEPAGKRICTPTAPVTVPPANWRHSLRMLTVGAVAGSAGMFAALSSLGRSAR